MAEKQNFENFIENSKRRGELQQLIDLANERTNEQIEISGNIYKPRDGDMVELPNGLLGGIIVAIPDKEEKYEIIMENGTRVKAPASKLLLRGCWTAKIYKEREDMRRE